MPRKNPAGIEAPHEYPIKRSNQPPDIIPGKAANPTQEHPAHSRSASHTTLWTPAPQKNTTHSPQTPSAPDRPDQPRAPAQTKQPGPAPIGPDRRGPDQNTLRPPPRACTPCWETGCLLHSTGEDLLIFAPQKMMFSSTTPVVVFYPSHPKKGVFFSSHHR